MSDPPPPPPFSEPYQPPGYPPPPPRYATAGTNGLAIASLVLGILWIYWIGSILALVFGYVAKSQIDKWPGTQNGRAMAIAGIVLGWVGVGFLVLFVLLAILGSAASDPSPNSF